MPLGSPPGAPQRRISMDDKRRSMEGTRAKLTSNVGSGVHSVTSTAAPGEGTGVLLCVAVCVCVFESACILTCMVCMCVVVCDKVAKDALAASFQTTQNRTHTFALLPV